MVNFTLQGGFTEGELDRMYGETLQLLEQVGMEVADDEIRGHLGTLPGITVRQKRICYARDLVEEWIEAIKKDNLEYSYNRKDGRIHMVPPYMGQHYHDPDTGEVRLATAEDMLFAVKLCDTYGAYGPSPIHLQTVPAPIRQVTTLRTCVENSREMGGWAPAANEQDGYWMCKIGEAARRPPPHCCMEIPISPLRLNAEALRMIFNRRGRNDQLVGMVLGGGAVPMAGATAPIFVPGCYIQGMAEALAAYITPQLIDPRVQGYCSFGGFLFDLRYGAEAKARMFPEGLIYSVLARQVILRFLGETMGSQICVEDFDSPEDMLHLGFKVALDILDGARSFLSIGAYGDGFCPVAAVIQADLVKHFEKFIAGREYRDEPGLTLRTVREALADGNFLTHPTTLDYRSIYLIPELVFKHENRDELRAAARDKAGQLVAAHEYSLPKEVQSDVTEVYEAACRDLLGKH